MKTAALNAIAIVLTCTFALGQQYKVLWSFAGPPNDGASPVSNLVVDQSGNLYGTTECGGSGGLGLVCAGTVFRLSPNGDGSWTETILYNFCSIDQCADGAQPEAGLVSDSDGNLYGTTYQGGVVCPPGLGGTCGTVLSSRRPRRPAGRGRKASFTISARTRLTISAWTETTHKAN